MRIGIDLMGSHPHPPSLCRELLEKCPKGIAFFFFADRKAEKELCFVPSPHTVLFFSTFICQDENPLEALRKKRDATLFQALALLSDKQIDAVITGGNTGALIAGANTFLPRFSSLHRPGLLAFLPHLKGNLVVIDVGGILSPKAENLFQFAFLGAATQKVLFDNPCPRVALLNVGEESHKGTMELKKAYHLLQDKQKNTPHFCFLGNCEASDTFQGKVDVLITEGFAGNIFLKTAEGLGGVVLSYLTQHQLAVESKADWLKTFDYQKHPGAIVCGVEGLVLKCHGSASLQSWQVTVNKAVSLWNRGFLPHLQKEYAAFMPK